MSKELNALHKMIAAFINPKVRTATAYMSPTYTMRLSLVMPVRKSSLRRYFALTLGKPNYEGRLFVKAARASNEPFPVKKVQLRMWPKDWWEKKKKRMREAAKKRKAKKK